MKKLFIAIFLIILIQACYYDNEELLYMSVVPCDTTNVTYSGTIAPIITTSCLGCHGNSVAAANGKGIKLENYSDLKKEVDLGSFRGAVFHLDGYKAMPKDADPLSNCKLKQIDIWLKSGAPNN